MDEMKTVEHPGPEEFYNQRLFSDGLRRRAIWDHSAMNEIGRGRFKRHALTGRFESSGGCWFKLSARGCGRIWFSSFGGRGRDFA